MSSPTHHPHRSRRASRAGAACLAAVAMTLAACSTQPGAAGGDDSAGAIARLQIMAPADPGGGWDSTARAMSASMESAGIAQSITVTNVPGAGGTIGLAQMANEPSEDFLMVMGLVMIGAIQTAESSITLDDVTPIAQLTAEDEVVVVPAESPYETIQALGDALEAEGRDIAIAGGSAGGSDHIVAGLFAEAAGASPADLNYVAFSGGGESIAALLGGKVDAGISGVSEYAEQIEAGKLRALAVSGPEPVDGLDAPTLQDSGYDVELVNWRGVVAPKDISPEAEERLTAAVTAMHGSPEWEEALSTNGWTDTFMTGNEFTTFIKAEEETTTTVLSDLGLVE